MQRRKAQGSEPPAPPGFGSAHAAHCREGGEAHTDKRIAKWQILKI